MSRHERWPMAPLSDVASIERTSVGPANIEPDAAYVGLENVASDGTFVDVGEARAADLKSTKFRFSDRHVLYGKLRPYLAKIAAPDFGGVCSTDILPIAPAPQMDRRFLLHYLRTPAMVEHASRLATGANLPRLSPKTLATFDVPVPPIEEQRRIAAVLDVADELRAKRREALARLDTLTQAIFLEMFGDPVENARGWPRATLGEILERVDSGKSPTCPDRPAQAGEWGVLKAGAVSYGFFRAEENKALPDGVAPDPRHEVRAGDILFSRKNTHDLVATTAYVDSTPPRLLMSDLIFRLVIDPSSGVDARFLQAQLSTPRTKRDLQARAGGSSGSMPNISKAKVRQVHVVVPPTEMQRDFASRVQSVEAAIGRGQRSAETLDALFSSLQQRAFRGEL